MGARLAAMGAGAGEAIVRACVDAVASGVVMALVPRVADVLGPAMHVEAWRASVGGWIGHVELAHVLCEMPDVCPQGRRLVVKRLETLRWVLEEWAKLRRRGAKWELDAGVWEECSGP